MRNLATYDGLTGVLRRHAFVDRMESFMHLSRREGFSFSVIALDIDMFKKSMNAMAMRRATKS
nr:diguanylate cyclase [Cyanobium sp. Morenito 9A2]